MSNAQTCNTKGGAYNLFCEIYIGRQKYKNEAVDQTVLVQLMEWDVGLNTAIQNCLSSH